MVGWGPGKIPWPPRGHEQSPSERSPALLIGIVDWPMFRARIFSTLSLRLILGKCPIFATHLAMPIRELVPSVRYRTCLT